MAIIDVTNKFLNADKRYSEGVVVTIPSVLSQGGGRSNAQPTYLQGGDAVTAQVVEKDTLLIKAYLHITEVFPAGSKINVDIAGTQFFNAVPADATGLTVSTTEDKYFANGQTVTTTITDVSGNITTGKALVILNTLHPSLKNGTFAS